MNDITTALDAGEQIGWRVLDSEGNVVASGPVTFAELTTEASEMIESVKENA